MAISLEELAAATLEGTVGPWGLAVGATALAVALTAGSARPLRRVAATAGVTAGRAADIRPTVWLRSVRDGWLGLVAEARAEYEADRLAQASPVAASVAVASASGAVLEPPTGAIVAATPDAGSSNGAEGGARRQTPEARDQKGRFVRRATNGARPG